MKTTAARRTRSPYRTRMVAGILLLAAITLGLRYLPLSDFGQQVEHWIKTVGADGQLMSAGLWADTEPTLDVGELIVGQSVLLRKNARQIVEPSSTSKIEATETTAAPLPGIVGIISPANLPVPVATQPYSAPPLTQLPDANGVLPMTIRPTSSEGYSVWNDVFVKNETGYTLDMDSILEQTPALAQDGQKPAILIVHTHGSEAFFPDEQNNYTPTDGDRTEDPRFNVIRLGDEMATLWRDAGFVVYHDRNIYDYPTYTGSYGRSLESVESRLSAHPEIGIVFDIHRDSIEAADGTLYKVVSEVEGETAAQLMLVVGTDYSGLPHPTWSQNLAFACRLQQQILEKYPTLMRPVNLRKERFNAHAASGALLVEVGASGNSLEEALVSARIFSAELAHYIDSEIHQG